jgi:uncharacterized hydrophobic protein (TIGR00271 family)
MKLINYFKKLKQSRIATAAMEKLLEKSRLEGRFLVMSLLSGIIATLGIIINDTAIIIAAMVLAPLLNPFLAFAAGIALLNLRLVFYAAKSIITSLIFIIVFTALFVYLLRVMGSEIHIEFFLERFSGVESLLLLVGFISGFAAVYSWFRASDIAHLVGVAIAVSLIPFVSFFGILIGMERFDDLLHIGLPFLLNIFAIIAGALVAFVALGVFSLDNEKINEELENTE